MTYDEVMKYIEGVNRFGVHLGLARIEELLKRLSNPEKNLRIIHVAGTNGKGSFCAFISQILIESGYKVGRYISPTLYDYRERIQMNHEYISKSAVAAYMTKIKDICTAMVSDGYEHPTLFEIETAMAFLYFKDEHCDIVVLEVGMGGRLDSTNVIADPLLSVITSISLDHTQVLGGSICEVASEKAGIIKRECPVLVYEQDKEALEVVKKESILQKAPVTVTDWSLLQVTECSLEGQYFNYKAFKDLKITMCGVYQVYNAAAAVDAACRLKSAGIKIEREAVYKGLERAVWPGRFEILQRCPLVIADGAHNPGGAKALKESLDTYFHGKKLIGIMGVFADKDYQKILEILLPNFKTLYTHRPKNKRGLDAGLLKEAAQKAPNSLEFVCAADTIEEAAGMALENAKEDDVIISFGSLSTIGYLSRFIKNGGKG